MNLSRLVSILLPLALVSCQRTASSSAVTVPSNDKSDSKKGTITVTIDGNEATPEEALAFGAFGKKLLSDAIHKSINDSLQEVLKKLDISDSIESALFSVSFGPGSWSGNELWSVYVIRPAKDEKEPRVVVLFRDGKPIIRFARAIAPVERPVAIMTLTDSKDGHLTQTEVFLVHIEGKWEQYRPSKQKESLK